MSAGEAPTPGQRRAHAWVTAGLGIAAAIALARAHQAASHAPQAADLYNLVYANSRPAHPEGTASFLYGFPVMLALGFAIQVAILAGLVPRTRRAESVRMPFELGMALLVLWGAGFFFAALHRAAVVLDRFG